VHAAEDYSVDAVDVYTAFYVIYAPCDSISHLVIDVLCLALIFFPVDTLAVFVVRA
jgi:hypothetical protein